MPPTIAYMPLWVVMIASAFATIMRYRYVKGTRQRYLWASIDRALDVLVILGLTIFVGVFLAAGSYGWAILYFLLALWNVRFAMRRWNDDDDFWNKLGRGVKKFVKSFRRPAARVPATNP